VARVAKFVCSQRTKSVLEERSHAGASLSASYYSETAGFFSKVVTEWLVAHFHYVFKVNEESKKLFLDMPFPVQSCLRLENCRLRRVRCKG
jgi:hypothetical protein